jgi:predicted acylesterase/phospholipase RssA
MAAQYIKYKLLTRIAGRMSIPDYKSVPKACYKPEGVHNHDEISYHKDLLAPTEALVSRPEQAASVHAKPTFFVKKVPPRRLALCGGGIRCIAHVGVLKELHAQGYLSCVKEVFGVSGGALFGLAFCLGYTLEQLERLALEFDFSVLRNITPESAFDFPTTFGLDSGEGLEKFLVSLLTRKGYSSDITFQNLKTTCQFRCYATDIQSHSVREFSAQKTPSCSVKLAVRASMSLPVLYTPVKDPLTQNLLMDGGILHNLPLVFLNSKERSETLAVLFSKSGSSMKKKDIELLDLFQCVYDSMTYMRNEPFIHAYKQNIILIPLKQVSALAFELSKEQKKELIDLAAEETRKYLFTQNSKPVRRFSCS